MINGKVPLKAGYSMTDKKIRILIADDHPLFRKGLKQIINDIPGMICAGEASTAAETLEKALYNEYDLLILDIGMPGNQGVDNLKTIRKQKPKLPVLVLSMHPESEYGLRVIRAGAWGYINKKDNPDELVKAIKKVMSGHKYITATLAEELAYDNASDTPSSPGMTLSDMEHEVLRLLIKGNTIGEIASKLPRSKSAVYQYRRSILKKTKTKNDAELARYAMKNRLATDINMNGNT